MAKQFNCFILLMLLLTGNAHGLTVLRVGVPDNPPLAVGGESVKPDGVAVELLMAMARRENWRLEYVYGSDADLLSRLTAGTIDVIAGLPVTHLLPTGVKPGKQALINDWVTLYSLDGAIVNGPYELEGSVIGYFSGDTAGPLLELFFRQLGVPVTLVPFAEQPVDAFPRDKFDYFADIRLKGTFRFRDSDWHETGFVSYPVVQSYLYPAGVSRFSTKIDGYLARWKRERGSPYFRILAADLGGSYQEMLPVWSWVLIIFGSLAFLALVMILFMGMLRREVTAKTRELKVVSERAVAADRLKTIFLANMSHEIRSPLNAIVGFARLLSEPDLEHERRKSYVEIINTNSRQLLYLISDILDFSRIESGEVELFYQSVPVRDLAIELWQNFERYSEQIGRDSVRFVSAFPEKDESVIHTDLVRLKQILTNLLNNAFKFTEKGTIEFGYTSPHRERDGRNRIVFSVRDTGIGIPESKQGEIFDRFRQVDEGYSRKFSGAGLGLTISRKLVELLDGDIRVESREGEGTTFFVSIPLGSDRGLR